MSVQEDRDMTVDDLLNKGSKKVAQWSKRNGYIVACDYEQGENYVVEFAKVCAGITIESVTVVFSSKDRVIEVK